MDLSQLEKILNIKFNNRQLLETALTHRSYLNEHPEYKGDSNERLEFLGDAVLSFLASQSLFLSFPKRPEGDLTSFRAALVSTKSLGKIGQELKLGQFLRMAKGEAEGGGRKNISLLADTLEAILGAIYLDRGLKTVRVFFEKNILTRLPEIIKTGAYIDAKSQLQEITQEKLKVSPTYKILKEKGPDYAKEFTIGVYLGQKLVSFGTGRSKQQAEEKAAKKALEKIG